MMTTPLLHEINSLTYADDAVEMNVKIIGRLFHPLIMYQMPYNHSMPRSDACSNDVAIVRIESNQTD